MPRDINIKVPLTGIEALAFAEFLKRVQPEDYERRAAIARKLR